MKKTSYKLITRNNTEMIRKIMTGALNDGIEYF